MSNAYIPGLTPQSLASSMAYQLDTTQTQLSNLTAQLSAGVNVTKPSDNPQLLVQILGIQSQITRYNQYQSNASDGLGLASLANSSMSDAVSLLQQARVTILQAGSPGITSQSVSGLVSSLQSDFNALVGIANTTYQGVGIFGGTSGVGQTYSVGAGNTVTYNGNSTDPTRTVAPGYAVQASVTDPFSQMFGALKQVISDLGQNPPNVSAAVGTDLGNFDSAFATATNAAGTVGAYFQQLTVSQQQATLSVQNLTTEFGNFQNLNMAQATTQFQQLQSNYQIALFVTSKSVQPSLAQYLP
ncbi:MAG: hypothetical protein HKL82_05080 [Acidimicrobiaceae bacterium]|nr:hypothetical protein [Acidimicrobiaceae bacterium]